MIVFTGGGTGGHIFPAIEIARMAQDEGFEVAYLGSLRGQESAICAQEKISFEGFPSEPIHSFKSRKGLSSMIKILKASRLSQRVLRVQRPEAIFSTGGYSAAPILMAAHHLRIPYVIHESNSIPGRTNRIFSKWCSAFTSVFHKTSDVIPHAIRTGQPIRRELLLRVSEINLRPDNFQKILITAGSQGSEFLNNSIIDAIRELPESLSWIHLTGPSHYEQVKTKKVHRNHSIHKFLQGNEIADAYVQSSLAIARSGGTLAELARFQLPSILVPLPSAADDHQNYNALEFESMGASIRLQQENATCQQFVESIQHWVHDADARKAAQTALRKWDIADSNERVWSLLKRTALRGQSGASKAISS